MNKDEIIKKLYIAVDNESYEQVNSIISKLVDCTGCNYHYYTCTTRADGVVTPNKHEKCLKCSRNFTDNYKKKGTCDGI